MPFKTTRSLENGPEKFDIFYNIEVHFSTKNIDWLWCVTPNLSVPILIFCIHTHILRKHSIFYWLVHSLRIGISKAIISSRRLVYNCRESAIIAHHSSLIMRPRTLRSSYALQLN